MAKRYVRRVGERDVPIEVTVQSAPGIAQDISAVDTREIVVVLPDRTTETLPTSLVTDGTDGKFRASFDITQAGRHRFWGRWETGTQIRITSEGEFWAKDNG